MSRGKSTVSKTSICLWHGEIWCECFGKDTATLKKSDSYEINTIMAKIEEWGLIREIKVEALDFQYTISKELL